MNEEGTKTESTYPEHSRHGLERGALLLPSLLASCRVTCRATHRVGVRCSTGDPEKGPGVPHPSPARGVLAALAQGAKVLWDCSQHTPKLPRFGDIQLYHSANGLGGMWGCLSGSIIHIPGVYIGTVLSSGTLTFNQMG